ncbi:MAG TPA: damage-control phosphatase ARMT1 family protein [Actinocrinis sp.]|nr:damage-control phosphatase ARMT1 family protein [Actinocrinis sp.]
MPLTTPVPDAPEITGREPGSFPHSVFHDRHPRLFTQVRDALPYGPEQLERLHALEHETLRGVITPLEAGAAQRDQWDEWGRPYYGLTWTQAPFLWAESFFYRKLLSATGFFGPGAWTGVDPFGPMKDKELTGPDVDRELAAFDQIADLSPDQRDTAMLAACLWGNRADLGFQITAGHTESRGLLVDDSPLVWSWLRARPAGRVSLIADNAARELLPDLLLLDHLLSTGLAAEAVLHVKPAPYYVSDATTADTIAALRRLAAAPGRAGEAGRRLWQACRTGRLKIAAHEFFCAPQTFHDLPTDLAAELAASRLTVVKGDLNYRRLVGDRRWPPSTGFSLLTDYFPSPVVALRTCKSEVAVGLDEQVLARAEAEDPGWRTSGTHAVIQLQAGAAP